MDEENAVYVAVPEEFKKGKSILAFAVDHGSSKQANTIIICHVHVPPETIPGLLGAEFPVSAMKPAEAAAYKKQRKAIAMKKLDEYLLFCKRRKMKAEMVIIENDDVAQGILELISQNGIRKLIMGAAKDKHYSKNLRSPKSKTAIAVMQNAAPSCEILFACKNVLIFTRDLSSTAASNNKTPSEKQPRQLNQQISLPESNSSAAVSSTNNSRRTRYSSLGGNWRFEMPFGSSSRSSELSTSTQDYTAETFADVVAGPSRHSPAESIGVLSYPTARSSLSQDEYEDEDGLEGAQYDDGDLQLLPLHHHGQQQQGSSSARLDSDLEVKFQEVVVEAAKYKIEVYEEYIRRRAAETALEMTREAHAREMEQVKTQLQRAKERSDQLKSKLTESKSAHQSLEYEREKALRKVQELSVTLALPNAEFSYSELEEAANHFSDSMKIGEGAFGVVYKGFLRNTAVAIKLLKEGNLSGQSQFEQEVAILSRVRHPNLVTLIGACSEASALVYEFLPNGSLEERLVCTDNSPPLQWQTRVRIICEVCSAIMFLHMHKPNPVVHGDLKPANILLDANFSSKLGDFGISRLLVQSSTSETFVYGTSRPIGSPAYMDPEFLTTGVLTTKSDVYSFGVIVLRLLSGKAPFGITCPIEDALEEDSLLSVVDVSAGDWPLEVATHLAEVGLRCAKMRRKKRPNLETEIWSVLQPIRDTVCM